MSGAKYQPFNDLSVKDFAALKADIDQRGVLLPIIVDEKDRTIDGHQRRQACAELHIDCPRVVLEGLTEDEKMAIALALNAFRRHLSAGEKGAAVQKLAYLGWSARRIALALGISHQTVLRAQADVDDLPETRIGADGKPRPATRPTPTGPHGPVDEPGVYDGDTGEALTGSEPREDHGGSDGAGASDDEGGEREPRVPNSPPSAPNLGAAAHPDDSYRSRMSKEFAAVRNGLFLLDPARMLEVSDLERRGDIESLVDDLRAWCDDVERHLTTRPRLEVAK